MNLSCKKIVKGKQTEEVQFVINRSKGTKGEANTEPLVVYPNPANAYFVVQIGDMYRVNSYVQIQDSKGVLVQQFTANKEENSILVNTATWQAGVYIVNLYQNDKQVKTMKLIVE